MVIEGQCRRRNSSKPRPLAARRAHENCFNLVVFSVPGQDKAGSSLARRIGKEDISRLSCASLNARRRLGLAPDFSEVPDIHLGAERLYLLSFKRRFCAQTVIDRNCNNLRPGRKPVQIFLEENEQPR